ncbi:hypothetical protein AB7942_23715 [Neobacillus sp. BF23-41]|uniref:hypothetical protein n=1 Tax=Neobacillus sp. BF23-41 TaxID=3240280 RepID=UPI0034E3B742
MQNNIPITSSLDTFINKNVFDVGNMVDININLLSNKLSITTLVNAMFKYINIDIKSLKKDLNLTIKTVRLNEKGIPKEAMSFEQIQFHKLVNEEWGNSFVKEKFSNTTFLFVVFQYVGRNLYFRGLKLWKMPEETLNNDLYAFWSLLKQKVQNGVILTQVTKGTKLITQNNLPSLKESKVMHVRPKAQNADDTVELPDGQFITKQCYWFNATYVKKILSDMPSLNIDSNQINNQIFSNYDYKKVSPLLSNDIYTIDHYIKLTQTIFPSFNAFDLVESELKNIGYNLFPPFILKNTFTSLDYYFTGEILKDRYFTLPNDDVWVSAFVQRKLENMENSYSIFKIDGNTYLTRVALEKASIKSEMLITYREAVEDFVQKGQYFTLTSLKEQGFHHTIEDFGFEPMFYESLLKRPGRLKNLKLCGHLIFIKTPLAINLSLFLKSLYKDEQTYLSIDNIIEIVNETYSIMLDFNTLNKLLKSNNIDQYYSEPLHLLFLTKNDYLAYIQ